MMSGSVNNYFLGRAEAELKMAKAADCPEAMRAHYVMAGHYLDRAAQDLEAPQLHQASLLRRRG